MGVDINWNFSPGIWMDDIFPNSFPLRFHYTDICVYTHTHTHTHTPLCVCVCFNVVANKVYFRMFPYICAYPFSFLYEALWVLTGFSCQLHALIVNYIDPKFISPNDFRLLGLYSQEHLHLNLHRHLKFNMFKSSCLDPLYPPAVILSWWMV